MLGSLCKSKYSFIYSKVLQSASACQKSLQEGWRKHLGREGGHATGSNVGALLSRIGFLVYIIQKML